MSAMIANDLSSSASQMRVSASCSYIDALKFGNQLGSVKNTRHEFNLAKQVDKDNERMPKPKKKGKKKK